MKNPSDVNPQELSALIASRICHDLIGPIGAIVNGLELLEMAGGSSGPELQLISDSAYSASARLRFFRVAFGAPGDQMMARADTVTMLEQIGQDSRMKVNWLPEGAQKRSDVKLAFLALQCCEAAMPRGGEVHVMESDGSWELIARADRVAVDPALWAFLEGGAAAEEAPVPIPAKIQFMLLPATATMLGRKVLASLEDSQLTLRF